MIFRRVFAPRRSCPNALPGGADSRCSATPPKDGRNQARIAGFLSVLPRSQVIHAGGWYFDDAVPVVGKLLATNAAGLFCVNDRLASAVLAHCRHRGHQAAFGGRTR